MKLKFLTNLGALVFLISIFYVIRLFDVSYEAEHPSLNEKNMSPDIHLNNVRHYTREVDRDRSLYHLDKAIQSIQYLKSDVDLNTSEIVEESVKELIYVYEKIKEDTVVQDDLNHAFEFALTSLSLAELRVSVRYAESNNLKLSRIALKYAKLHLKHALEYAETNDATNYEKHIYHEIDSLLANFNEAPVLITERINHMVDEFDSLILMERSRRSLVFQ